MVVDIVEDKDKEKEANQQRIKENSIKEYLDRKKAFTNVKAMGKSDDQLTVPELKTLVHWKKRKRDVAVPTKKEDLKARYQSTKDRPDWTLAEYMHDRGILFAQEELNTMLTTLIEQV